MHSRLYTKRVRRWLTRALIRECWGRIESDRQNQLQRYWGSAMKHVGVGMVCLTPVVQGCCSRLFLGSLFIRMLEPRAAPNQE